MTPMENNIILFVEDIDDDFTLTLLAIKMNYILTNITVV
jgi:hypothetical protein